jgi:hypothetical protein
MRKLLMFLIALAAIVFAAPSADSQGFLLLAKPGGGGLDPATTLWVNQVSTNGGTVSGGRKTIVDTFIKCLKTAANGNLFAILDRYYLLAGEDTPSSSTDMIHPATSAFVNHGMTFLANNYISGNGSSQYLDTGYNPNTAGGNYVQNSASMLMHIHNQRTTLNNVMDAGADDSGAFTKVVKINGYNVGIGGMESFINNTISMNDASANSQGSFIVTRTGATAAAVYENGSSVATSAAASVGVPTSNIYIGAMDLAGPTAYVPDQISTWGIGGGFSAGNASDFNTCESAMLTSLSINP